MKTSVEACCGSLPGSITAWKAGASRIELNSGLETGGLTPSAGVVSEVLSLVDIPVTVMIRPRTGDFIYSPAEKKAMLFDIENMLSLGATGVVTGAMLPEGLLDHRFIKAARKAAEGSLLVFHRAFDLLADKPAAADLAAGLGVDAILSSGGEETAWQGRVLLKKLCEAFGSWLDIIAASGVDHLNAPEIVSFTGCRWIHGSFRGSTVSELGGLIPEGFPDPSTEEIRLVLEAVSALPDQ